MRIVIFDKLLAAEHESKFVQVWLPRYTFVKNGEKWAKNDDFEGFHDIVAAAEYFFSILLIPCESMNFSSFKMYSVLFQYAFHFRDISFLIVS